MSVSADQKKKVGTALLFLSPLSFLFNLEESVPFIDSNGQKAGSLEVSLLVETFGGNLIEKSRTDELAQGGEPKFTGEDIDICLNVKSVSGLTSNIVSKSVELRFKFSPPARERNSPNLRPTVLSPDQNQPGTISQIFSYSDKIRLAATEALREWLSKESIEFELWAETREMVGLGAPSGVSKADGADNIRKQIEAQATQIKVVEEERDKLKKEIEEMKKGEAASKQSHPPNSKACSIL